MMSQGVGLKSIEGFWANRFLERVPTECAPPEQQ
jgi:hypothetical protein